MRGNNGVLRENTLSKSCMMEYGGAYINKENSTQVIAASLEDTVKRRKQEDSQEPRDKFTEIHERCEK